MFNGIKNFAVNRALKHLVDNNRVDQSSNLLSIVVTAVLAHNIDWMLAFDGIHFKNPAAVAELARALAVALVAALLFAAGKCPKLAKWFNLAGQVAQDVQQEIATEATTSKEAQPKHA